MLTMSRHRRQRSSRPRPQPELLHPERGVALILVVFVLALAMIIVTDLAYETNLSARLNAYSERSVRAEYILKSAINISRAILRMDESTEDAGQDPTWGPFSEGLTLDAKDLGIDEPNATISLEIRPVGSKLRISNLLVGGRTVDPRWFDVFRYLFRELGFDDDKEEDHTGLFPGKVFKSDQLVLNLIDYMDRDTESAKAPDGASVEGIEGDLPPKENVFPNTDPSSFSELQAIPGFTAARIQKLYPYLTVVGDQQVNVNVADKLVLKALDKSVDDGAVDEFIAERQAKDGAVTQANKQDRLRKLYGEGLNNINHMLTTESRWFSVVAKVDYGTSHYFARAYLSRNNASSAKEKPVIRSIELF